MTALLQGDAGASKAPGAAHRPGLGLHGQDDTGRAEVEDFIRRVYRRRYGAQVQGFAPMLVSLRDPLDGELVAAAGYREARRGRLFLEGYLEQPVESMLAARIGVPFERDGIVEIGHLAADRAGAGPQLMRLLGPHLAAEDFRWAVCTLTQELHRLMVRLGITPVILAAAEAAALADDASSWGSYYEHRPLVLAGELQPALRRLLRPKAAGGLA